MTVNTHDDEIDILVCPRKNNASDVSVGSNVALHDDLNSMPDKPRSYISTGLSTMSCDGCLGVYS